MSVKVLNPERFARPPAAVLVDLDNTLYPYQPAHDAGMAAVRDKAARSVGAQQVEFDQAFDTAREETKEQLGSAASSHSRLLYFSRTLENLGLRSQPLLSLEFEQAYWINFLAAIKLREGVLDFLDILSRSNIPKVIVTDLTSQIQLRKLVFLGLDRQFEYVVTSEESGADKPSQASFNLALEKLSLLHAPASTLNNYGEVWMIGDNMVADIGGAKTAINATTLAIRSEIERSASTNALDMVFDSFTDLEKFIANADWNSPPR